MILIPINMNSPITILIIVMLIFIIIIFIILIFKNPIFILITPPLKRSGNTESFPRIEALGPTRIINGIMASSS